MFKISYFPIITVIRLEANKLLFLSQYATINVGVYVTIKLNENIFIVIALSYDS